MKPRVIPGDRKLALAMPSRSVRLEKSHVRVNPKPFPLKPAEHPPELAVQKVNGAPKTFEQLAT